MAGITITADTSIQFEAGAAQYNSVARIDDDTFVVAYSDDDDFGKGKVVIGTRSGYDITISEANAVTFSDNNVGHQSLKVNVLSSSLIVIAYSDDITGTKAPTVVAATISGTTITVGTPVQVRASSIYPESLSSAPLDSTHFVVNTGYFSGTGHMSCYVGTVSGTTITLGSAQDASTTVYSYSVCTKLDGTHFGLVFANGTASTAIVGIADVDASTISFSGTKALSGMIYPTSIDSFDTLRFIACGPISAGNNYYLQAAAYNSTANTISAGSYLDSGTTSIASVCAIYTNHFIISYGNGTGTVRSGTLSGSTALAWDAQGAVSFDSNTVTYSSVCALDNTYFVVGYKQT